MAAEDGASITVPAGAAEAGAEIRAEVLEPEDAPPLPEYATQYLAVWDFDVAGGLDAPVTLRLPASDLDELWVLAHYVDGEWRPAGFDIDGDEIVVDAESLSLWGKIKSGISWAADGAVSIASDVGKWLKERGESLLRSVLSPPEPIRCKNPDAAVTVDWNRGRRMMSACAERDSPDPLLRVQNDRTFWIQICSPNLEREARMVGIYPTRLLSDCPDGSVGGMLLSSGNRASYASKSDLFIVEAQFGTVPQLVTMIDWIVRVIPGLSSVELPSVVVTLQKVIDGLQRIPELAQAINAEREGDVLRTFEKLTNVFFSGNVFDKVVTVLIDSGLLRQLGVNISRAVLKEAAIVADLVGVAAGITDLWLTYFSNSDLSTIALFSWDRPDNDDQEDLPEPAAEADDGDPAGRSQPPAPPPIGDGSLIVREGTLDLYQTRIISDKRFKRLILNEAVFDGYGFQLDDVRSVGAAEFGRWAETNLARLGEDKRVWRLVPDVGRSTGERRWLDITAEQFEEAGFDWDAVIPINQVEFDEWREGAAITAVALGLEASQPLAFEYEVADQV